MNIRRKRRQHCGYMNITTRVRIDARELPAVKIQVGLLKDDPIPRIDFQLHTHIGHTLILSDLAILQTIFQRVCQEVLEEKVIEPNNLEVSLQAW
jgi:hypothetical protein